MRSVCLIIHHVPEADLIGHQKSFAGNTDDSSVPWTWYSARMQGHPLYSQKEEQLGVVLCNIVFSDTAGEFVFPVSVAWTVAVKGYWFFEEKHFRNKIQNTSWSYSWWSSELQRSLSLCRAYEPICKVGLSTQQAQMFVTLSYLLGVS